MKAILAIGDIKFLGDARVFGLEISFTGNRAMIKRKIKNPINVALKRLDAGVKAEMTLFDDPSIIYLGELLGSGISIGANSSSINTTHKLRDRSDD